jgi:hypothetical protein
MITKSIRVSQDILSAIDFVGKEEKIEQSSAMRKLIRIGFEKYVADQYGCGKITLRQAAKLLALDQFSTVDLLQGHGVKGNHGVSDVMDALQRFARKPPRRGR